MIANGWVPIGPSVIYNGAAGSGNTAPVSGRVTAVVADPQNADIVYVGTATGGVWKSTDRGLTWKAITDDQASLSVGALALDPKQTPDNPKLYIATGEANSGGETLPGIGVLIYIEKPAQQCTLKGYADLNLKRIFKIIVLSGTPNNEIWLATNNGLYHSTDDGDTWTNVAVGGLALPYQVTDMVYVPGTPDSDLYVAVFGSGIYQKHGTGTFNPILVGGQGQLTGVTGIQRIGLAACDSQPKNMYAVFGKAGLTSPFFGIWASTDGGATWIPRKLPSEAAGNQYTLALAVNPQDPTMVFFGETNLWRSTDSGQSWSSISQASGSYNGIHADQHVVVFSATDTSGVWAGNDGGIWLSEDGGKTFSSRNRGLQTVQYYSIAQHPTEASILLAGAQDNGVTRYEGSPTWDQVAGGDGFFCVIDPQTPKRCYSSYTFMYKGDVTAIQRSDSYGASGSWSYRVDGIQNTFPKDASIPFYSPFAIDPKDPSVLYLGTNRLYRTENYGGQWTAVQDLTNNQNPFSTGDTYDLAITAIAVDPNDTKNVYVGTFDGRVIKLTQDATNKNQFTPSPASKPPITTFISDLAVPPTPDPTNPVLVALGNPQVTWAKFDDLGGPRIFVNSGAANAAAGAAHDTWTSLYDANLDLTINGATIKHSANPVNAITIDPKTSNVYIGCNLGIFQRQGIAPGASWSAYNDNLPNVPIGDLQFHAGKRLLRAATMGRSTWERNVDQAAGGATVDLYIRDNIIDVGRPPTPATDTDPTSGDAITPVSGADVKIDTPFLGIGSFTTPASTQDYTANTPADYIAFAQFGSDNLRRGVTSRIYVQVINRGPADAAKPVKVRAFWASKGNSGYPALPANFWSSFPDSDPDTTDWKPFGAAVALNTLRAGEPQVVSWDYKMPSDAADTVGLLACVTSDEDPVAEDSDPDKLDALKVATANKRVALREVGVNIQAAEVIIGVLLLVGVAAAVTGVALAKK